MPGRVTGFRAVFPLGMDTVCTFRLAAVANAPLLLFLPRRFIFIALAAWAATFIGLVRHVIGTMLRRGTS